MNKGLYYMYKLALKNYKDGKTDLTETILTLKSNNQYDKNEGVIYTPDHIAKFMIEQINYSPEKTILEPSVGHGNFIFSLLEYVEEKFKMNGLKLKEWFENKVYCFDINEESIKDFKSLLLIYFEKKGVKEVDLKNIKTEDPLFFDFKISFDIAIGNPPYVRSKNIPKEYLKKIKKKYKSCQSGNIDLFYAFTELTHCIATESIFIVPNSYIINSSAKILRKIIKEDLVSVIDFKHKQIFEEVRTYTSIYHLNKNKKNKSILLYKENRVEEFKEIEKSDLNDDRWVLSVNDEVKNKNQRSILSECNYYGSIATLRDSLYIINNIKEDADFYIQTYKGVEYNIEKELCIDYYKPTKPGRKSKIIFPYKNGSIINENILKNKYPNAYIYLEVIKEELLKRDKGKTDKYEAWYAYGRKQSLNERADPYVLLLPMMANSNFICQIKINPPMYLLTAGFALGFQKLEDLNKVKTILESDDFFIYIKKCGKVWAGNPPYFSFSKTQLSNYTI